MPCVISAADHAGWAHFVCVAAPGHVPAVIERRRVTTIVAGLPTMPYHHESLALIVDDANVLIARVRRSVAECTSRVLREAVADLAPAYRVIALAIREPTFPELPDTVAGAAVVPTPMRRRRHDLPARAVRSGERTWY